MGAGACAEDVPGSAALEPVLTAPDAPTGVWVESAAAAVALGSSDMVRMGYLEMG